MVACGRMATEVRDILLRQLDIAWALTQYHLESLTTEECLRRPAPKGLHVHAEGSGWRADWPDHEGYDLGPSSVAWLTWHLVFWWSMVLDHSFGPATLAREDVKWPGSADEVRARTKALYTGWRAALETLDDEALRQSERSRWPLAGCSFADIVAWANVELMKSAAEIGYARFVLAVGTRDLPLTVYFNPSCSKSRAVRELIEQRGLAANYVQYLDDAPSRAELERLLVRLGTDDARVLVRTGDALYAELDLDRASAAQLLEALAAHPSLLERPIVVRGEHAVIARPPEKALPLLDA